MIIIVLYLAMEVKLSLSYKTLKNTSNVTVINRS